MSYNTKIKIKIDDGLVIPSTATLTTDNNKDMILNILCYTQDPDITFLLKINKSLINTAYEEGLFFDPMKEEGFAVAVSGEILQNKDNINKYLSILVSDITINPFPVDIPKELQEKLCILQGRDIRKEIEDDDNHRKHSLDKMEISNILLDDDPFIDEPLNNPDTGYNSDPMDVETSQENINSMSQLMADLPDTIEKDQIKETENDNTIVVETIDVSVTERINQQTSFSPVNTSNHQSDQLSNTTTLSITTSINQTHQVNPIQTLQHITESQNQQLVPYTKNSAKKRKRNIDPKELRRSPRLALKEKICYFPKRRKYNRRMITAPPV